MRTQHARRKGGGPTVDPPPFRGVRSSSRRRSRADDLPYALTTLEHSMSLLLKHQSNFFQTGRAPLRGRFAARLPGFVALMKPRVMSLAVFTAFVGLAIAPGHLDPLLAAVAIGAIAAGAGAAGVLNMWFDADIDAVMARTARRPIPREEISRAEALVFGLILACGAVGILVLGLNIKAAALLAFAIFFYVVVD